MSTSAHRSALPAILLLLTLPPAAADNPAIAVPAEGVPPVGDVVPTVIGREVIAGPGRRLLSRGRREPAGEGQRQGAWQTLGVADGLPDGSVTAIFLDRDENMWFGTFDGICRYDGEAFTTFHTADGSWSNWVYSIAQDRQGDLWLGTGEGLRRFDGKAFTTFTTDDGLPDDGRLAHRVTSVLVDREGDVWLGTEAGLCRYDGESFTALTRADGLIDDNVEAMAEDSQGNLWFGTPQGASRFDGEHFESFTSEDGLAVPVSSIAEGPDGEMWFGTWGAGACRFDGEQFTTFTEKDGLANDRVYAISTTRQGELWFGTRRGVSRYDGQTWSTLTTEDGLAHEAVQSVLEDRSGDMWFGTGWEEGWRYSPGRGVSRYVGEEVVTYTMDDGLHTNTLRSILEDRQGNIWFGGSGGASWYDGQEFHVMEELQAHVSVLVEDHQGSLWFGTAGHGVYRYDGTALHQMTVADGLASNSVMSALVDGDGHVWFGCGGRAAASRYDGEAFVTYDSTSGLWGHMVQGIEQDQSGYMWFGVWGGAFRLAGGEFVTYTMDHGLGSDRILSTGSDRRGNMWFGLDGSGVSRYDGEAFVTYSTPDGLTGNYVKAIAEDRQGHLWFGTNTGITRFDGRVFQTLRSSDGLPEDDIGDILQDSRGDIWIGTWSSGVARFRPGVVPPPIRITDVVADRAHGPLEEIRLSASQDHLVFEFSGTSFKTRPNHLVYVYRMVGHDSDWRQTRERRAVYEDLPVGEYVFQVQAVDRDLTYSEEPAEVSVEVHLPYGLVALVIGLGASLMALVAAGAYGIKRRRERDLAREQLLSDMEEELQTAHDMQMGLMPTASPEIQGLSVAGRCVSANQVGGDFYQYFPQDDSIWISLADVTGHAMKAAIPAVMFSGILGNQMEEPRALPELLASLNRSLCRSLGEHTFICLSMVCLDTTKRSMSLSNCGCPYPLHYQAETGRIAEVEVDAYPLGVRPDTNYRDVEAPLGDGDYLVLHSDGFSEAADTEGKLFGFDRTMEVVWQGCSEELSPKEVIERLLGEVRTFTGDVPQADDMTCVVIRMDS